MTELFLLAQIAWRNLFSSFLNFVIGGIIFVGTLFFVVGGSVLNSIDSSMSRSIIGSVAGHVQVYAEDSKDELALFGDWSYPNIGVIPNFTKVKAPLLATENVKSVIPMGVNGATVTFGNTVDVVLEKLRKAINEQIAGDNSRELKARIESLTSHVRQMVSIIQNDFKKLSVMASQKSIDPLSIEALERAASPEFWSQFPLDPLGSLEFLENRIASLVPDADYIMLAYVGTDIEAFRAAFDRLELVDGEMIPPGQRGLMLSKYVYEKQFKMKTAYRLDKINEAISEKKLKIATDPDLRLMVKQNMTQTREVVLQLDPLTAKKMSEMVAGFLYSDEKDLNKLLTKFFETDDVNFAQRYRFFYEQMAPLVQIYRLVPGDSLVIKAFTKSGFIQAASLKIYGTFRFKGLEKSGLAGGMSLMDLMSFRDLYGYVTPEKLAETKALKTAVGAKFVDRAHAEAELFGGSSVVAETKNIKINDAKEIGYNKPAETQEVLLRRVYTKEEIEGGVALNAAIILKDPSKIKETMNRIREVSTESGLNLRVIDWQKAAGNLGQFVFIGKMILYFAVFIIFIVALVIINNAVMMATMQRVREIGTMRAIGAQRTFVLGLVLVETLALGAVFGLAGTATGSLIVKILGQIGIPANNDFLYFFFSGPRLYITLGWGSLVGAFVIICAVTSISALYPAIVATRVSPLQAMQSEE